MSHQDNKLHAQPNKKNERSFESVNRPEQVKPFAGLMDLAVATWGPQSEFSSETQAVQLHENLLQTAQQQSLVQGIGRAHGNHQLQRMIATPSAKKKQAAQQKTAVQRAPDSADQTLNDDLGDPISFPVHNQVYAISIEFPATASLGLEVKIEFGFSTADPTKAKGKAGPFKGELGELKRSLKFSKDGIKNQLSSTVAKGEIEIGKFFDSLTVSIGGKVQIPVDIEDLMKLSVASVIIFQAKGDGTELLNKLGRELPAGIQATIKVEVSKKISPKDLARLKAMGKLAKQAAQDSEKLAKFGKSLERARDNAARIEAQAKELENLRGQKAQELRKRLQDRLGRKSPKNISGKKVVSMLTDEEKAIFNEMNTYKKEARAVQKELTLANKSVRGLKGTARSAAKRVERAILRAKSIGRKLESKLAKKLAGVLLKKAAGQILKILSGVGWILTAIDIAVFLGPILWNLFNGNWGGKGGGGDGTSESAGDGELVDDSTPTADEVQGAAVQGEAGQGEPGQVTGTPTGQQGTSDVPTDAGSEKQEGQKVMDPNEERGEGKGPLNKAGPQGEGEQGEGAEGEAVEGEGTSDSSGQSKEGEEATGAGGQKKEDKKPADPGSQKTEGQEPKDATGTDVENDKSKDNENKGSAGQAGSGQTANNPLPTLNNFDFKVLAGYSPFAKYKQDQEIQNFKIRFKHENKKTYTRAFPVIVDQPPIKDQQNGTIVAHLKNKTEWKIIEKIKGKEVLIIFMPAGDNITVTTYEMQKSKKVKHK
jgi:hypothetical protein